MSLFVIWLGVMFPLVASPGPANIVFAASGAKVGVKKTIPLILGIDTVFIIKSIAIGYGFGQFINTYPDIFNVLQLLGALYLGYLAVCFIKNDGEKQASGQSYLGFVDGLLIQILNSKGWLMVVLMFSLFAEHAQLAFGDQGVLMLVIWLAILNISIHLAWVKMGELLARLSSDRRFEKSLNVFYAVSLLIVAGWLTVDNPIWQG